MSPTRPAEGRAADVATAGGESQSPALGRDETSRSAPVEPRAAGAPDAVDVPASLSIFGAAPTRVTASFVQQPFGRRAARAAVALAGCWAFALVSVFIPLAHFILVPALLFAGVAAAVRRAREGWRLTRVRGMCPRCRSEQVFTSGRRARGQWTVQCPKCYNELALVIDADRSGAERQAGS